MRKPRTQTQEEVGARETHPRIKVGVHPQLIALLEQLAELNHSNVSEEIRNAIRHYLRHLGLLAPLGRPEEKEGGGGAG